METVEDKKNPIQKITERKSISMKTNNNLHRVLTLAAAAAVMTQFTLSGTVLTGCAAETLTSTTESRYAVNLENATSFVFSDSGIAAVDGNYTGYKISGTSLTINSAGVYEISGSCTNGSIKVKKGTTGVTLVLNGITLASDDTAPLCFNKSSEVTVLAAENTVNTFSDTEQNNDDSYPDNENAENAVIKCKDGSNVVIGGTGTINITANGKNGIKSGATTDEEGEASLTIDGVTLNINAPVNDAVNAEAALYVKSGTLDIFAADDALHSDYSLIIGEKNTDNGPTIRISSCYEGLEGANVEIYAGDIEIHSEDDGINAAISDLSGYNFTWDIYGGNIYVDAETGDGIDSNGSLNIAGGTVEVFSTSSGANSPLDSDGTFTITGGTVLAVGNSGMAQTPETGSQNFVAFGAGGFGGMGGFVGNNRFPNGSGQTGRPDRTESGSQNGGFGQPGGFGSNGMAGSEENTAAGGNMLPGNRPDMGQSGSEQPSMPSDGSDRSDNTGMPDNSGMTDRQNGVSIAAGDTLTVTDSENNVLYTATAVRSANYVLFSDASLEKDGTYTLNINGTAAATSSGSEGQTSQPSGRPGANGDTRPSLPNEDNSDDNGQPTPPNGNLPNDGNGQPTPPDGNFPNGDNGQPTLPDGNLPNGGNGQPTPPNGNFPNENGGMPNGAPNGGFQNGGGQPDSGMRVSVWQRIWDMLTKL